MASCLLPTLSPPVSVPNAWTFVQSGQKREEGKERGKSGNGQGGKWTGEEQEKSSQKRKMGRERNISFCNGAIANVHLFGSCSVERAILHFFSPPPFLAGGTGGL